ncbi:MAG: hypothetical protein WBD00_07985 [Candidatus Omnitrophota bacterium]
MEKIFLSLCVVIIVFSFFLPSASYSQNLEEIKARARTEARQQMGLDQPQKSTGMDMPRSTGQELLLRLVLFAMGVALIPAIIAKVKGRSFIAWWVLGFLCFPVVLIVSLFIKKVKITVVS